MKCYVLITYTQPKHPPLLSVFALAGINRLDFDRTTKQLCNCYAKLVNSYANQTLHSCFAIQKKFLKANPDCFSFIDSNK